jgi:carbon-monoxide dehydrogenase small subunit
MKPVGLTVNAISVVETVEPRMHLADLLRERLGLTGTHLRCEQGACGACTLLIDGQPARSCITYAVLCEGAQITTIEGLEDDPVMIALRRAFTAEHGLQCGFCTPGMLITARDIVTRLPDADERRVRLELSGNLCRCTGYVGIVRAIRRVLDERRAGALAASALAPRGLGPVGSRHAGAVAGVASAPLAAAIGGDAPLAFGDGDLGLAGKKPILKSISLSSSRDRNARCGISSPRPNASSRACPGPRSAVHAATGCKGSSRSSLARSPLRSTARLG